MKKRVFLLVLSLIAALFVSVMTSFAVLADEEQNAPDTSQAADTSETSEPEMSTQEPPVTEEPVASPYVLEFLTGTKLSYNMTEKNGSYYCTVDLTGGDFYPLIIKDNGATIGNLEFLLYKENDGEVEFSYNAATGMNAKYGEGDAFDVYSWSDHPYKITVEGGKIENLPGDFASKNLNSFFYDAGEKVAFSAIVDPDKQFKEWECKDEAIKTELEGKAETVSFTLPKVANKDIVITSVLEMKELTLEQMLLEHKSITLEKSYIIEKTIVLTEGEYSIDLGNNVIECPDTVFMLNGATLTLEGGGEINNTGSGSNYAIMMTKGNLVIDGCKISGYDGAVRANAGVITIQDGELVCGNQTSLYIEGLCEATVSGGTFGKADSSSPAIWLNGGKLIINGGTFYGKPNTIRVWDKSDIRISSGNFSSDVSEYVSDESVGKMEGTMFVVAPSEGNYILTVVGGKESGIYKAGSTVTVTVDKTDKTTPFKCWVVTEGEFTLEDSTSETITFEMPACDIKIKAEFEAAETTAPETAAPETTPAETKPAGNAGDVTTDADDEPKSTSNTGLIICIIILVVLLIAAIAVAVILIIKKMNESREEAERAELGSSVVDDLADQLAMLDFSSNAASAATDRQPQTQGQPRIRRPRARPTANFEPEDLTVTKEHRIDPKDGE